MAPTEVASAPGWAPRAGGVFRGRRGYPRPQLQRAQWTSLDGSWDFALDPQAAWTRPCDVTFDRSILVPFAPESPRSGVDERGLFRACWYRRKIEAPALEEHERPGERVLLHFGAVDYEATVWLDGTRVGHHEGGYTPFEVDVTELLRGARAHELVVRAEDDPADMGKPRGKQDWHLEPHSIWYPRTSGICRTPSACSVTCRRSWLSGAETSAESESSQRRRSAVHRRWVRRVSGTRSSHWLTTNTR